MKSTPRNTISIVTLGCSKNTVDSEVLMGQLEANGMSLVDDPDRADVLIINTCGFIDAAKEESVNAILEASERKKTGRIRELYVAGCLSGRYREELERELPLVDGFFGVTDFQRIVETLGGRYRRELLGERRLTTPGHYAYIKISEGCDNPCSFCAIPLMRGGHVSRPFEEIVHEARHLALGGAKELIIIGQDTTYYGIDRAGRRMLAELLDALAAIDGFEWIRLMYAYPSHFPLDVLDVMRDRANVCSYLDIPVQHSEDAVLKSMRRGISRRATLELIDRIRSTVPDVAIRSTLIVGYPNETAGAFERLLRFVEEAAFDRLGVFLYSVEDGTSASLLGDPVPAEEKERRRAALMQVQGGISLKKNLAKIGSVRRVLIDRIEDAFAVGRTEHDAPEVDNEVLLPVEAFRGTPLIGSFVNARIDDATEFDLIGTIQS